MSGSNETCKNHFDTNILRPISIIDDEGFPQYKRTKDIDLVVVAHSIEALMDWEGTSVLLYQDLIVYSLMS